MPDSIEELKKIYSLLKAFTKSIFDDVTGENRK